MLFVIVILSGFIVSLGRSWLRRRRNVPLDDWVMEQPVMFSTPVLAQKCYRGHSVLTTRWVGGWNPNSRSRPELVVKQGAVELVQVPGVFSSGDVCWHAEKVVMWRDSVGPHGWHIPRPPWRQVTSEGHLRTSVRRVSTSWLA